MRVLVIAPHPDDEIIGTGGMIAKRTKEGHDVYVCIVTKGSPPLFSEDSVKQVREECIRADKILGVKDTFFLDFPAVMLEMVPRYEFNGKITEIIQELKPDEVYIPHRGDMQLDHQIVVDAAMVALRPKYKHTVKKILSYETLSETGWNVPNVSNEFIPNVYEDITAELDIKIKAMCEFKSQLSEFPAARSVEAIEALARYRGATVNCKASEAFSLVRELK